jgi:hypothetical protein
MMFVSGAVSSSIVHAHSAAIESTIWCCFTASTVNVCCPLSGRGVWPGFRPRRSDSR